MTPPKNILVWPVVMAGGSGTRLWPLSRSGYPKQFLVLSGNTSLFQQAVSRLQGLADATIDVAAPVVVGNEEHRFLVLDQLREIDTRPCVVLLEPIPAGRRGRAFVSGVCPVKLNSGNPNHHPTVPTFVITVRERIDGGVP